MAFRPHSCLGRLAALLALALGLARSSAAHADPVPALAEGPRPELPRDRGPVTTATFTLTPARPLAPGRAALTFTAIGALARVGDTFRNGVVNAIAMTEVVALPELRADSLFVACRLVNESAHEAWITTGPTVAPTRLAARSVAWVTGGVAAIAPSVAPGKPSQVDAVGVYLDRCEATGFGVGAAATTGASASAVLGALRIGVSAHPLRVAQHSLIPAAQSDDVVLSARAPSHDGASLSVVVAPAPAAWPQLYVDPIRDQYRIDFLGARQLAQGSIDLRVDVTPRPQATASVTCRIDNTGDRPLSLAGQPVAPGASASIELPPPSSSSRAFGFSDGAFFGAVSIDACRVHWQSSAATSPGTVAPGGVGGLAAPRPPVAPPAPSPSPGLRPSAGSPPLRSH